MSQSESRLMNRLMSRLAALVAAGALEDIDLHFARAVARWGGSEDDGDEAVILAAVLASHLSVQGHVCVDLDRLAGQPLAFDERWIAPELAPWQGALGQHPACGGPGEHKPLILDGHRLYLARHWCNEAFVAQALRVRAAEAVVADDDGLHAGLARYFPAAEAADQRRAAERAVRSRLALVSGGPGTGKTTTLTALLALVIEQGVSPLTRGGGGVGFDPRNPSPALPPSTKLRTGLSGEGAIPRILLAAPTGKAAARMQEAVASAKVRLPLAAEVAAAIPDQALTLHRLLGLRPDGGARHHAGHPLPVDLLVVDEASMVDLSLMAKVLAALPATARLVLLGDRDQLASVEAGAVFADLCQSAEAGGALQAGYGLLRHSFRFGAGGGIGRLAALLRAGEGEGSVALLTAGGDGLSWQREPTQRELVQAALAGYGAYLAAVKVGSPVTELHRRFAAFRLLAAHRQGPWGIHGLNAALERAQGLSPRQPWYPGRPVMVTGNDYALRLFNGDIGIAAHDPESGDLKVWFEGEQGLRGFLPGRLPGHETAWAMTVHKSQGSEFDRVLLALPDQPSPLVTRELVYTAVTRARHGVSLWATEGAVRAACAASIERYSGLAERLGAS